MRGPRHDLRLMAQLATLSGQHLKAGWRTALADLARAATELSTPLEGLDPAVLLAGVSRAEQARLLDDLAWLSPPATASALYHIAAALPAGPERTRMQARVRERLSEADAATFIALATALAQSDPAQLQGPAMRARVALCLGLPVGTPIRSEPLAVALISRPDLARVWLEEPSQGALPSRRLAARILEQTARVAARRTSRGDASGLELWRSVPVQTAFQRLLADRESLVWKHAAAARGLLSEAAPALASEVEKALDAALTPTEWRRGAASLAARIAVAPKQAGAACRRLLESDLVRRDPGIAAAILLGLPRASEVEPQEVEPLLVPLLRAGGVYATEAFVELLGEGFAPDFGRDARALARRGLQAQLNKKAGDEGQRTLMEALVRRLDDAPDSAGHALHAALGAFAQHGMRAAAPMTRTALAAACASGELATQANLAEAGGRHVALSALLDLESSVLQSSALPDLLALCDDGSDGLAALDALHQGLTRWLVELHPETDARDGLRQPTLHMRAIRALLHLVDAGDWEARQDAARARRRHAVRSLFQSLTSRRPALLHRARLAAAARGAEALVRDRVFELSDVVIAAMLHLREPGDLDALAEASMGAELERCLNATSALTRCTAEAPDTPAGRSDSVRALLKLVQALPAGHSPRTTSLRDTLLRIHICLQKLLDASSLIELVVDDGTTLADDLIHSLHVLAQLVGGARMRIDPATEQPMPELGHAMQQLADSIEAAVQQRDPSLLRAPLASLRSRCEDELPYPLHAAIGRALGTLPTLPLTPSHRGASMVRLPRVTRTSEIPAPVELPAWLPPNRTLGSFYVLHSIGEGGGGSVFVATRTDERDQPDATLVALKVPEYDGATARALSEQDFLQMFREEAGALLAMPQDQPNLARFVTFDAGVRPKPILVMEYVEGPSLERLLARRHLEMRGAFDALLGIARGLTTMHALGVAHLDVKPSNVILRNFWSGAGMEPVLVDFGMSGRRLRPGCCTANYGAPEIWDETDATDPRPADVYAFGCLAFEVLTGKRLFNAPSDIAMISAHMLHDGMPPGVETLYDQLRLRPLAEWLIGCLRKEPQKRTDIQAAQTQLSLLQQELGADRWPVRTRPRKRA